MGMDQIAKKPKRAYINRKPKGGGGASPPDAPRNAVKAEFAYRLQQALNERGWNQSEFARRCTLFMSEGETFSRDNVSRYVRGLSLPHPVHLHAMAGALHMAPDELLPTRGIPSAGDDNPPEDIRGLADGRAWLRINQAVDWDDALEIMAVLKRKKKNQ